MKPSIIILICCIITGLNIYQVASHWNDADKIQLLQFELNNARAKCRAFDEHIEKCDDHKNCIIMFKETK